MSAPEPVWWALDGDPAKGVYLPAILKRLAVAAGCVMLALWLAQGERDRPKERAHAAEQARKLKAREATERFMRELEAEEARDEQLQLLREMRDEQELERMEAEDARMEAEIQIQELQREQRQLRDCLAGDKWSCN